MQISTRTEDFVIDTLELRSDMYILNESLTDPAIVKVGQPFLALARECKTEVLSFHYFHTDPAKLREIIVISCTRVPHAKLLLYLKLR